MRTKEVQNRFLSEKEQKFYTIDEVYHLNGENYFYGSEDVDVEDEEVFGDWFMDTGFADKDGKLIWNMDLIKYKNEFYLIEEDYEAKSLIYNAKKFPTVMYEQSEYKDQNEIFLFTEEIANKSTLLGNGLVLEDINHVMDLKAKALMDKLKSNDSEKTSQNK